MHRCYGQKNYLVLIATVTVILLFLDIYLWNPGCQESIFKQEDDLFDKTSCLKLFYLKPVIILYFLAHKKTNGEMHCCGINYRKWQLQIAILWVNYCTLEANSYCYFCINFLHKIRSHQEVQTRYEFVILNYSHYITIITLTCWYSNLLFNWNVIAAFQHPFYKYKLAKGSQRVTAKQKWRKKSEDWRLILLV